MLGRLCTTVFALLVGAYTSFVSLATKGMCHLSASKPCMWIPLLGYRGCGKCYLDVLLPQGMCHLHASQIVHGDLKPQNVLLKSSRSDRRGFIAKVSSTWAACGGGTVVGSMWAAQTQTGMRGMAVSYDQRTRLRWPATVNVCRNSVSVCVAPPQPRPQSLAQLPHVAPRAF